MTTTVALAIAVCALVLLVLQTLDAPSAAAAEIDRPIAPTNIAAESPAAPAPTEPAAIAAAPVAPVVEDEFTLAEVESFDAAHGDDRSSSRRAEASAEASEDTGSDSAIEDNPYDAPAAPASAPTPEATETPAPARAPENEVEDLIESALSRPVMTRVVSAEATNLMPHETFKSVPETPSRAQVRRVMNGLLAEIRSCGGETYDRLVVRMTVVGETGRVTAARTVDSNYAGTAVGTCAARVARMAKFPRFAKNELVVKYPFEL